MVLDSLITHPAIADLLNKQILIVGLGVENYSLLQFFFKLQKLGLDLDITIADAKSREELLNLYPDLKANKLLFITGDHYLSKTSEFDVIFRTPGVSYLHPEMKLAVISGKKVTSHTQFFCEISPTSHFVAVTGTKGKGTTTTLIASILKASGKSTFIGGNIGKPPLDFIEELTEESFVCLELSSFQLMDSRVRFPIAVVLMVTSEHLDYHKDTQEYIDAKKHILAGQQETDAAIINVDYPNNDQFVSAARGTVYEVSTKKKVTTGCYVKGKQVFRGGTDDALIDLTQVQLRGEHNYENIAAAVCVGSLLEIDVATMQQAVYSFAGLEHRIERVTESSGITYYNDSFSTIPETTIAAITSFDEPITLILGGSSKNSDFSEMASAIHSRTNIKNILLIGVESARIKEALEKAGGYSGNLVEGLTNMTEIVDKATKLTPQGGVVLLSPACASFDMFKNYKDRGEQFKQAVHNLIKSHA